MTIQPSGVVPTWTRGDRLRKARVHAGLSTADLAERMGVSVKTVNNAESDKHEVRRIVLNAWSLATGVAVEWLETGQAPAAPPNPPSGQRPPGDQLAALTEAKRRRARGGGDGHTIGVGAWAA